MGMVIPIVMICLAAASTTAAVIAAIEIATVLTIALAAIAVAATIASVYFYIQGDIKNSMLFAGIGIAAGIGGLYVGAQDAMATVVAQMEAGSISSVAVVDGAYASATLQIYTYIEGMYASFSGFLEAIHFKAVMAIHQIAYLMSGEYRAMVDKLFNQIREVSGALHYGFDYMGLMLSDARYITLSVSAALGRSYDLAEVTWLTSEAEFLKHMSTQMERYQDHPGEFLWDLNQMVVKPGVDTMALGIQAMILGTEKTLEVSKAVVEDVVRIRNDIMKFVVDQPAIISGQIYPKLKELTDNMDRFIKLNYDPAMQLLSTGMSSLGVELTVQKTHIGDIIERLRKPGTLLSTVDELADDERLQEERAIYRVAIREQTRETLAITAALTDAERDESLLGGPPKEIVIEAGPRKGTPQFPVVEKTGAEKKGKGPFVGDF